LRTGLALAARLSHAGRNLDAYRCLLHTGFEPDAGYRITLGQHVTASARLQIAERLQEVAARMTEPELAQITNEVDARVAAAVSELEHGDSTTASREFLAAAAELPIPASVRVHSLAALADWELARTGYERAEQYLLQALDVADEPALEAAVLIRLAYLATQPTQNTRSVLASRLKRLRDPRLAALSVPGPSSLVQLGHGASTVGEWVAAVQSQIDTTADTSKAADAATEVVGIQYGGAILWQVDAFNRRSIQQLARGNRGPTTAAEVVAPFTVPDAITEAFRYDAGNAPRLVDIRVAHGTAPTDRAVFYAADDVVYCQRVSDGALLWHTTLKLPESFDMRSGTRMKSDSSGRRSAVMDGQIIVFNARFGLFAVGARTGRRLWFKPYEQRDQRARFAHGRGRRRTRRHASRRASDHDADARRRRIVGARAARREHPLAPDDRSRGHGGGTRPAARPIVRSQFRCLDCQSDVRSAGRRYGAGGPHHRRFDDHRHRRRCRRR